MTSERLPRPGDYATYARYFAAVLSWLQFAYPGEDNRIERARIWAAIEESEWNVMPIRRKPKTAAVETPLQRAVREEMAAMMTRASYDPDAPNSPESLAYRKRLDRAVEKRQRKHPEESRADSLLAVIFKQTRKRDAEVDAKEEADDAEERAEGDARRAGLATDRATTRDVGRTRGLPSPTPEAPAARKRQRVSITQIPFD